MDSAQIEMLVQRLVADPHDENALALAHQAGTQDPQGYAMLLERVAQTTTDEVFAAHWYSEAAMVWESLGDTTQCNRLLQAGANRDPSNQAVVDRVTEVLRSTGDTAALVELLERVAAAVKPILHEQAELRPMLMSAHEELAGLHGESNPNAALEHWGALSELDPQNVMAIYSARELLKSQSRWSEALPFFAKELACVDDPERKVALYRDAAEVRRSAGDLAGATDSLRLARQLQPDDPALTYEFGLSIIERIDANQAVPANERQEATDSLIGLAEMFDGEHGMTYAQAALRSDPSNDRAMQLADYYAEQLGRQQELAEQYTAYLQTKPDGYMAEKAASFVGPVAPAATPAPGAAPVAPSAPPGAPPLSQPPIADPTSQAPGGYPSIADPTSQGLSPQPQIADPTSQAAAAPPGQPDVPTLLAQANDDVQRGRKPQAYQTFRQVLELEPANTEALGWVEDFLRQRRKFTDLRDVLLAASRDSTVSADTRKAQLRDVAGLCESKLRDFDTAVSAWKQICQIDRGDEQAREHLLGLLEKQKRWDEIAPLLEQQVMNEVDSEVQIALEKKLAQLHEQRRSDPAAAAETWLRIVILSPGDEDAIMTSVGLFEQAEQLDRAADAIAENLADVTDDAQRGLLFEKLGELRTKTGDTGGAGDAFAEAAELLEKDEAWQKAAEAYRTAERFADAAHILEKRAQIHDGAEKAKFLADAADMLIAAGNPQAGLAQLEAASEFDPNNDELATRVEEQYHQGGRHDEQVAFLLRRAENLDDQAMRVGVRHRAAAIQRSLEDEDGARDSLQLVLLDGDDITALQLLLDMAERREDWEEAVSFLKRLTAECEGEDKLAYAVREAQLLADGLNAIDDSIARYQDILEEIDKSNLYSLHAIAELELRRENPPAAAEAMERLLELLEGEEKLDIARQLAPLYEGPLDDVEAAMRVLDIVHAGDPEDFDAIARLQRLAEKIEDWPKVATYLGQLIEVEGDDEEASEMTRQLSSILTDKLEKGDEALGALEKLADEGDAPCQAAYEELGIRLDWKGIVATKLVAWNESIAGSSRAEALRRAFDLFLQVERDADARTVALDLARTKDLDAELAARLEEVAVRLKDLDAMAVAHDIIGAPLTDLDRAEEYVRQAEAMTRAGADGLDAMHHGELALSGIEASDVQQLLPRLAALTEAPGHVIDLFERQVARCKKPEDRVAALAQAAQVAAERGAVDRARDFFNAALSGGVHEDTLTALEQAARDADEAANGGGKLLRTLAEALAAGGQGSRDGGRTRSALLRRAASISLRELNDPEAAFEWLGDSIIAHVDDAALDALNELGEQAGAQERVKAALTRALEEVYDGPLVRKLLRRRADLLRGPLKDIDGAAADLKRLHDLSPSDQDLAKELSKILTTLGDHRGMIELYEDQILRGREPHVRAELARKVARIWEEEIGDAREAADAWRRVLRMKPGDKEATAGRERVKSGKLKKPPPVRRSEHPSAMSSASAAGEAAPEDVVSQPAAEAPPVEAPPAETPPAGDGQAEAPAAEAPASESPPADPTMSDEPAEVPVGSEAPPAAAEAAPVDPSDGQPDLEEQPDAATDQYALDQAEAMGGGAPQPGIEGQDAEAQPPQQDGQQDAQYAELAQQQAAYEAQQAQYDAQAAQQPAQDPQYAQQQAEYAQQQAQYAEQAGQEPQYTDQAQQQAPYDAQQQAQYDAQMAQQDPQSAEQQAQYAQQQAEYAQQQAQYAQQQAQTAPQSTPPAAPQSTPPAAQPALDPAASGDAQAAAAASPEGAVDYEEVDLDDADIEAVELIDGDDPEPGEGGPRTG